MAPPRSRGRPRKGQTRFDAAFDAMKDFGFADKLIKSTIKELLEVYMDEWRFIEEGSYEVLRENLLEKANESEKDDPLRRVKGVSPAGSSIKAPGPTHSNREIVPIEVPLQTVSEAIAAIENPKLTEKPICNAYAEGERSSGKDKNAEPDCIKINQTNNVQGTGDGSSSAAGKVERSKSHCPSEFGIGSEKQEAVKAFPSRTRRPCYEGVSPAGSSIKAPGPTHSNREIVPIEVPLQTVSEAIAATENPKLTEKTVRNAYVEGERSSGKDKNAEPDCIKINQTNNVQGTGDGSSSAAGKVERSKSHCPSEFGIGSEKQEAVKAFPSRIRRPCYGWISDSDEPLERMMDLIPARATLDELLSGKRVPMNRKRRWDCKA